MSERNTAIQSMHDLAWSVGWIVDPNGNNEVVQTWLRGIDNIPATTMTFLEDELNASADEADPEANHPELGIAIKLTMMAAEDQGRLADSPHDLLVEAATSSYKGELPEDAATWLAERLCQS